MSYVVLVGRENHSVRKFSISSIFHNILYCIVVLCLSSCAVFGQDDDTSQILSPYSIRLTGGEFGGLTNAESVEVSALTKRLHEDEEFGMPNFNDNCISIFEDSMSSASFKRAIAVQFFIANREYRISEDHAIRLAELFALKSDNVLQNAFVSNPMGIWRNRYFIISGIDRITKPSNLLLKWKLLSSEKINDCTVFTEEAQGSQEAVYYLVNIMGYLYREEAMTLHYIASRLEEGCYKQNMLLVSEAASVHYSMNNKH